MNDFFKFKIEQKLYLKKIKVYIELLKVFKEELIPFRVFWLFIILDGLHPSLIDLTLSGFFLL